MDLTVGGVHARSRGSLDQVPDLVRAVQDVASMPTPVSRRSVGGKSPQSGHGTVAGRGRCRAWSIAQTSVRYVSPSKTLEQLATLMAADS